MAISIGSNITSLQAQRQLGRATSTLGEVFARLSSGQRINKASDDAAGIAISCALNTDSRIYSQAIRNANDGISLLNIAESAVTSLKSIVTRQLELAEQAANGSYTLAQRRALDKEANSLVEEYNRIIASTEYNGEVLFKDTSSSLILQLGYGKDSTLEMQLGEELLQSVGTGTFSSVMTLASSGSGMGSAVGDFNEDGICDITLHSGGAFGIYLSNGDGTFGPMVSFHNIATYSATVGDLNNDGHLDIIKTAYSQNAFYVFLGRGDGTFNSGIKQDVNGVFPTGIEVADFNGDSQLDLAIGSRHSDWIEIWTGNGDGTFIHNSTTPTLSIYLATTDLALGDFNQDGITDIIDCYSYSRSIFLGTAEGILNFAGKYPGVNGAFVEEAAVGDFNRDGLDDIASVNTDYISISYGNGDGTFSNNYTMPISGLNGVITSDLTGDGILDLICSDWDGDRLVIIKGEKDGTFKDAITYSGFKGPHYPAVADFNNDGAPDIVFTNYDNGGAAVLFAESERSAMMPYLDLLKQSDAKDVLTLLKGFQERCSSELGNIGALQSRIYTTLSNLTTIKENIDAANSRIQDADIALESATLLRNTILQQAAQGVLAQANQQTSLVLSLIG